MLQEPPAGISAEVAKAADATPGFTGATYIRCCSGSENQHCRDTEPHASVDLDQLELYKTAAVTGSVILNVSMSYLPNFESIRGK